jgi:hypothetical protein
VAVPLAGLERTPLDARVKHALDWFEVATTPGFQASLSKFDRRVSHTLRVHPRPRRAGYAWSG